MAPRTSRQLYLNRCSECGKKLDVISRSDYLLICCECLKSESPAHCRQVGLVFSIISDYVKLQINMR